MCGKATQEETRFDLSVRLFEHAKKPHQHVCFQNCCMGVTCSTSKFDTSILAKDSVLCWTNWRTWFIPALRSCVSLLLTSLTMIGIVSVRRIAPRRSSERYQEQSQDHTSHCIPCLASWEIEDALLSWVSELSNILESTNIASVWSIIARMSVPM